MAVCRAAGFEYRGVVAADQLGRFGQQADAPALWPAAWYAVRVLGPLSDDERQSLLDGVQRATLLPFGSIEDGGGEGANRWYRVTISEGHPTAKCAACLKP